MHIYIDSRNGVPIYLQIVNQVKYLIASGKLSAGSEVLPIRTLAEQLVINPNTVVRAYRELESAGLLVSRRGAGTYVAEGGSPLADTEKVRILSDRIDALLVEADQLEIGVDVIVRMLKERRAALKRK
jgi:GntR family transcriptional regulator